MNKYLIGFRCFFSCAVDKPFDFVFTSIQLPLVSAAVLVNNNPFSIVDEAPLPVSMVSSACQLQGSFLLISSIFNPPSLIVGSKGYDLFVPRYSIKLTKPMVPAVKIEQIVHTYFIAEDLPRKLLYFFSVHCYSKISFLFEFACQIGSLG